MRMKKMTEFLTRNRIRFSFLFFALFIIADVIEKRVPYDIFDFGNIWGPAGGVLVLAGAFLRSWSAGVIKKNKEPADTGPYALLRHPLYTGSFLIAVGFCAVIGDIRNFFAVAFIVAAIYIPIIKSEEKFLKGKFGAKYGMRPFPAALKYFFNPKWSFSHWLRNREYNTFTMSIIMLALLKILNGILS